MGCFQKKIVYVSIFFECFLWRSFFSQSFGLLFFYYFIFNFCPDLILLNIPYRLVPSFSVSSPKFHNWKKHNIYCIKQEHDIVNPSTNRNIKNISYKIYSPPPFIKDENYVFTTYDRPRRPPTIRE